MIVWNNTESGANSLHEGQRNLDSTTLYGSTHQTENISVGDHGYIARVATNTWNVNFIRGNVTVSLQFTDNAMGFQPNHDERYLYEVSMAVSMVQDLEILDYQSSTQNN